VQGAGLGPRKVHWAFHVFDHEEVLQLVRVVGDAGRDGRENDSGRRHRAMATAAVAEFKGKV
jgi:alkylated DNA nucleotide flippase Atl1